MFFIRSGCIVPVWISALMSFFLIVVLFCTAALVFPLGFYIDEVGGQPYKLPNNTVVGSSYVLFVLSIFFTIVGLLFAGKVCLPGWHGCISSYFCTFAYNTGRSQGRTGGSTCFFFLDQYRVSLSGSARAACGGRQVTALNEPPAHRGMTLNIWGFGTSPKGTSAVHWVSRHLPLLPEGLQCFVRTENRTQSPTDRAHQLFLM